MLHPSVTDYASRSQDKPYCTEIKNLSGYLADLFLVSGRRNPSVLQPPCREAASGKRGMIKMPHREIMSKLSGSTTFRGLLSLCTTHQAKFDEIHISAVWSKFHKLSKPTTWKHLLAVSGLLDATLRLLLQSDPRTVSTVAHSAAKVKYSSSRIFDAVVERAKERLDDFKPQELANSAWAFAKVDCKAPKLLEAVADKAEGRLDDFTPQGLANMLWAFATLDHRATKLFKAVERAEERLDDFKAQELANMVWAFATLDYRAQRLLAAVAWKAEERLEDFKVQELANIVWAFVTLDHQALELFASVAEKAEVLFDDFAPQGLANIVWAYATFDYTAPKLFAAVAEKAVDRLDNFKPQELANTVWAFATLDYGAAKLFEAMAEKAEDRLDDFKAQELANVVWAFATLDYGAPRLLAAVAEKAEERLDDFKPQELANTVWAFTTLDSRAPKLFESIDEKAEGLFDGFEPHRLVSIIWAFATLDHIAPNVFEKVVEKAEERLDAFDPQALANFVWACATLDYRAHDLFEAVAEKAEERLDDFSPQGLANIVWAFATLDHTAPRLFEAVAEKAEERLDNFKAQNLANIVWAFATNDHRAAKLFEAVAGKAEERLNDFKAQELANTAWAFTTLGYRGPKLFEAVAERAEERLDDFKAQNLANTVWAFATLDYRAPKLFEAVAEKAEERLDDFNSQQLANMIWAFATNDHRAAKLFEAVTRRVEDCLHNFSSQELANMIWAFATIDCKDPKLLEASWLQSTPRIFEFVQAEFKMLLMALSQRHDLTAALDIMTCWRVDMDGSTQSEVSSIESCSALLMDYEQRLWIEEEVAVLATLVDSGGAVEALTLVLAKAATNALSTRLLAVGRKEEAKDKLREAWHHGRVDCLSETLWSTFGGDGFLRASVESELADVDLVLPYSQMRYPKESRLLVYVLSEANFGDPGSVCDSMEHFGKDVLSVERRWLKIAGDSKTEVLKVGVSHTTEKGFILEIGTYCGYSALRISLAKPGVRIVCVDVNPGYVVIARNVVAFAGMSRSIDIWTGHSKDVLPRLPIPYLQDLESTFSATFLDGHGSGFDEDVQALESLCLLEPSAAVIADNVLKPCTPSLLWRICKSGAYTAQIISLPEFADGFGGMDWMCVSVRKQNEAVNVQAYPFEILQMQWESDRIRARAMEPSGVTYEEWSAYATHMERRFDMLGIGATMHGDELCVLKVCLQVNRDRQRTLSSVGKTSCTRLRE